MQKLWKARKKKMEETIVGIKMRKSLQVGGLIITLRDETFYPNASCSFFSAGCIVCKQFLCNKKDVWKDFEKKICLYALVWRV